MDEENVGIARGLGNEKIGSVGEALGKKRVVNQTIFLRRKDMRAEIQVVAVVIDKLEGQHGNRSVP
jgi:hypothetical protein